MICGGVALSRHFCLKHRIKDAIHVHKRRYGNEKPTNGKWIKLAAVMLKK